MATKKLRVSEDHPYQVRGIRCICVAACWLFSQPFDDVDVHNWTSSHDKIELGCYIPGVDNLRSRHDSRTPSLPLPSEGSCNLNWGRRKKPSSWRCPPSSHLARYPARSLDLPPGPRRLHAARPSASKGYRPCSIRTNIRPVDANNNKQMSGHRSSAPSCKCGCLCHE